MCVYSLCRCHSSLAKTLLGQPYSADSLGAICPLLPEALLHLPVSPVHHAMLVLRGCAIAHLVGIEDPLQVHKAVTYIKYNVVILYTSGRGWLEYSTIALQVVESDRRVSRCLEV
jgi:hypothetical protein